jgi:hypothetical protein
MSTACHLERVALYTHGAVSAATVVDTLPGPEATPSALTPLPVQRTLAVECCEYCDAAAREWRKCKQICLQCGQINRSCADL